jgi:flagellar biosynthesis/type III secretory pathway chaperone
MFEKRNVKIQELYEEKQLLVQKIEDLEQWIPFKWGLFALFCL